MSPRLRESDSCTNFYFIGKHIIISIYIAIKICAYECELKLIVWDHGKEWNGFSLRHENADEALNKLNDDLAESGRGIPIMAKIATQISRRRYSGLNESIFIIPVATGDK